MLSTLWIDLVLRQNFIFLIWWRARFYWQSEKDSVYLAVPETEWRLTFLRTGLCFAITALSVWPDISRACWVHHTPGRHLCKLIQHRRPLLTSSIFNLTENFKNWPQNSTCHHTYQWMKDKRSRLCDITVACLHPPTWLEKQHSTGLKCTVTGMHWMCHRLIYICMRFRSRGPD